MMELFSVIAGVHWEPKVGDPTVLAWLTVVAYFVAAFGCGKCAINVDRIFEEKELRLHRIVWWSMSAILVFLGLNKQLDLQTWFSSVAWVVARHYNILEWGQRLQILFIAGLAIVSMCVIGWVAWQVRREWRRYALLLIGTVFIVCFILVRAAYFFGVDLPNLSTLTGGFQINWLLELLGAIIVACSAFLNLHFAKKEATR